MVETTDEIVENTDFLVQKSDWHRCRFVPAQVPDELKSGQVLFRVDRFAFTSNNISYALAGDMIGFITQEKKAFRLRAHGGPEMVANHPRLEKDVQAVFGLHEGVITLEKELVPDD